MKSKASEPDLTYSIISFWIPIYIEAFESTKNIYKSIVINPKLRGNIHPRHHYRNSYQTLYSGCFFLFHLKLRYHLPRSCVIINR